MLAAWACIPYGHYAGLRCTYGQYCMFKFLLEGLFTFYLLGPNGDYYIMTLGLMRVTQWYVDPLDSMDP